MQGGSQRQLHIPFRFMAPTGLLILLMAVFAFYAVFVAVKLRTGIIPDEIAHLAFSEHFASSWGIPADVPATLKTGWYIQHNPFLDFWLNGRALNVLGWFLPAATEWQMLVFLRLLSVVYALGTVYLCFLLAKEFISSPWWQLLPVFLLTNTLMFVFLAGGVSYDNLANLLCAASLLLEVRALRGKHFVANSLGWMIAIGLGMLVKYTIVPLALFMGIAWMFFAVARGRVLFAQPIPRRLVIGLSLVLASLVIVNLGLYGVNLFRYHSLTPDCSDLFTQEQCELSPFVQRFHELGLAHKMSIAESIEKGYPDPLVYVIDSWIPNMLYRIYGILGHLSYFPSHIISIYRLWLLGLLLLAFRYIRRLDYAAASLAGIFMAYAFVLLSMNYDSELVYGFRQIAMQGRYIFPLIGAAYVLAGWVLAQVSQRFVRLPALLFTLGLFFLGGPVKFLLSYHSIFKDWFF